MRGVPVYFVRDYDPKTREAEGTWRGEMNDIELETHEEAMKQNRSRLRHWAQIGQKLYAKLPGIATSIENQYHNGMTDDKLHRTAKHADIVDSEVTQSVEALVDSMELPGESDPDAETMMDDKIEEEVGEIPDSWEGGEHE
jgi:hypothetical protein